MKIFIVYFCFCRFCLVTLLYSTSFWLCLCTSMHWVLSHTLQQHILTIELWVLIWKGNKLICMHTSNLYTVIAIFVATDFIWLVFCWSQNHCTFKCFLSRAYHFSFDAKTLLISSVFSSLGDSLSHINNFRKIFILNITRHWILITSRPFSVYFIHTIPQSLSLSLFQSHLFIAEIDFSWFNYCIPINSFTIDLERGSKMIGKYWNHFRIKNEHAFQTQMRKLQFLPRINSKYTVKFSCFPIIFYVFYQLTPDDVRQSCHGMNNEHIRFIYTLTKKYSKERTKKIQSKENYKIIICINQGTGHMAIYCCAFLIMQPFENSVCTE